MFFDSLIPTSTPALNPSLVAPVFVVVAPVNVTRSKDCDSLNVTLATRSWLTVKNDGPAETATSTHPADMTYAASMRPMVSLRSRGPDVPLIGRGALPRFGDGIVPLIGATWLFVNDDTPISMPNAPEARRITSASKNA